MKFDAPDTDPFGDRISVVQDVPMTPPDRAPEPRTEATVLRETFYEFSRRHGSLIAKGPEDYDALFEEWAALLDAARDSRPVGEAATAIAAELERVAPPKIEGGSPARAQWLADVLAVQIGFHAVGAMEAFVAAMNGEPLQAGPTVVRPVGEGLDEERLIEALRKSVVLRRFIIGNRDVWRPIASEVAAEYRRLSTTQPASTEAGE